MALVVIGLYGTLTYSVRQRTREIGIRLALGASPRRVATFVFSEVGTVTAAGLAVGGAGAWFVAGLITPVLFAVSRSDLWTTVIPLACLLACGAVSAVVPAVRATRIDPARVLRGD